MTRQAIEEMAERAGIELLLADGLDDAFLGWIDDPCPRAVYSIDKCIDALVRQGLERNEAIEHFEFNTLGAYVGPATPLFIHTT